MNPAERPFLTLHMLLVLVASILIDLMKTKQRRWWVKPHIREEQRFAHGAFTNVFLYCKISDCEEFYNFVRMTIPQFEYLHNMLQPRLQKFSHRRPLSPELKLAFTLHYIAHGDSLPVLAQYFRIGKSTAYAVVISVCQAIFDLMKEEYLSFPNEEGFKRIAKDFKNLWDFPNCVGAMDMRQFEIIAPSNSGTFFYNYKKYFSIGLLAVCDAHMRFTWASAGSYGSLNDATVYMYSDLSRALRENIITLPPPAKLENTDISLPHFIIADAGFPLLQYLITPFSRLRNYTVQQRIFNYRHSRARRIIECAFGLLASKWRVFRKPLAWSLKHDEIIIMATLCIHNYLITLEMGMDAENRRYTLDELIEEEEENIQQGFQGNGVEIRNTLQDYFMSEHGEIPFQYERI